MCPYSKMAKDGSLCAVAHPDSNKIVGTVTSVALVISAAGNNLSASGGVFTEPPGLIVGINELSFNAEEDGESIAAPISSEGVPDNENSPAMDDES